MGDGFIHLVSPCQEYWLHVPSVVAFETPGRDGKPMAWADSVACWASFDNGRGINLDAEQWAQAKRILGFEDAK